MTKVPLLLLSVAASMTSGLTTTEYQITSAEALAAHTTLGAQLVLLDTASSDGNWTYAKTLFQQTVATAHGQPISLENIGRLHQQGSDVDLFVSYYGTADYASTFVNAAITNTAPFDGALTDKMRAELTMKGVVLQSVTMGALNTLRTSIDKCVAKVDVGNANGAPSYVDLAWALFSAKQSQIALGEKRCPQFNTCLPNDQTLPPQSSKSIVNNVLLGLFHQARKNAQDGQCWALQNNVELIAAQLTIPVIQGMLREAYEVDPSADGVADGLVEVCEGWGFAAAVLPRIARCNATAGTIVNENMNTVSFITSTPAGSKGVYMKDGFQTVVDAVENTFACLGITCQEVKAMVAKGTSHPLWQSCRLELNNKDNNNQMSISKEEYETWRQIGVAFIVISIALTGLLCFSMFCSDDRKHQQGRGRRQSRGASDLCAAPRAEPENLELHEALQVGTLEVTVEGRE